MPSAGVEDDEDATSSGQIRTAEEADLKETGLRGTKRSLPTLGSPPVCQDNARIIVLKRFSESLSP